MSYQIKWALGILAGAIGLAVLMVFLAPQPDSSIPEKSAPLVETVPLMAASGEIPVLASGTVQPRDEVTIGAQVSGRITYISPAFREGNFVQAHSTLVRIDPTDYRNQVRIAEADVAAQNVAVLQAQEEVAIARADLEKFTEREAAREQAEGATGGNGTAQILAPRSLAQPQAKTSENEAEEEAVAEESQSGLATREPQLRSAEAARQRAQAGLADAQTALARTRISVPFSGLVRSENVAMGTLVQVGQSLGSVAATDAYEVRLSLTEDEAAMIPGLLQGARGNIGAEVFYDFGGLTYRWPAYVDRADASLDETTRTVEVFLRVPNPMRGGLLVDGPEGSEASLAPPLLLGAFVDARITGSSREPYAAIPASALRSGNEIWVVRDGALRILPVRVIQRSDKNAFVTTASLSEGGEVITSNLPTPAEGMPVRVSGEEAE